MAFAASDAGFSARLGSWWNVKAILRVMRKLDLLSAVRRRRPYTRYQQAVHKYPNLLDRNFDQAKPNQSWVTGIIYIPIPGSMLYMCAVLDLCGKAVLAWKTGADMSSSLVTDTIRETLKREKATGGPHSTVTKGLNTHRKHTST